MEKVCEEYLYGLADVVQHGGKNGRDFEQDEYILESLTTQRHTLQWSVQNELKTNLHSKLCCVDYKAGTGAQ